jgi:prophage protein DUF1660
VVVRCRIFGHRFRFSAAGTTMTWSCMRCGAGGSKTYESAGDAARFARAFDREDLGRRAPLIGLLPLRLWRVWHDRRAARR